MRVPIGDENVSTAPVSFTERLLASVRRHIWYIRKSTYILYIQAFSYLAACAGSALPLL